MKPQSSFGSAITDLQYVNDANKSYRYGFNNQEKDNEIVGKGDFYAFEYRMHDARIGRFLSIDPLYKKYPYYSPYQFAGNTPIVGRDLEGLENSANLNTNERNSFGSPVQSSAPTSPQSSKPTINTSTSATCTNNQQLDLSVGLLSFNNIESFNRFNDAISQYPQMKKNIDDILKTGKNIRFHNDASNLPAYAQGADGAFTYESDGNFSIYLKDLTVAKREAYGVDPIYEELFHMKNAVSEAGYQYNSETNKYEISNENLLAEEARAKFQVITSVTVNQYYVYNIANGLPPILGESVYYTKDFTSMGALIGKTEDQIKLFISNNRGKSYPIDVYYQYMYNESSAFSQYSRPLKKSERTSTTTYPQEGAYDYLK